MKPKKDVLFSRLRCLKKDDIKELLVGGLKMQADSMTTQKKEDLVLLCSKELRSAAGSSTVNLFRDDHEFPYKQILIDVADKLSPGHTILSWTNFTLEDNHTEKEIEDLIASLFEEQAKLWWDKLPADKKKEFVGGINNAVGRSKTAQRITKSGEFRSFITQQMIENLIQTGIMTGLVKISASGILGTLGISVVAQIGWLIVLQTVGWMGGVKFLLFGIAGQGAMGGAVTGLGGLAIGGVLSIPSLFAFADGAAYRKTVPTIVLLIAKHRMAISSRDDRIC